MTHAKQSRFFYTLPKHRALPLALAWVAFKRRERFSALSSCALPDTKAHDSARASQEVKRVAGGDSDASRLSADTMDDAMQERSSRHA